MVGFSFEQAKTRQEFERLMLEHAHEFKIIRFLGRGQYDRLEGFTTLEQAREAARSRPPTSRGSRRWMVYAVCYVSGALQSSVVEII